MAANAAAAIVRLGAQAIFWGPTGDDEVASTICAQLVADGVDVSGLHRFAGRTSSHSAVIVDARGERLVVGLRGDALQVPADWLPVENIAAADAVLADVRWPVGAKRALSAAREAGVPAILDGEIAQPEVLMDLGRCADHVIFSQRGLEACAGSDDEAGLRRTLGFGARVVAVTRGNEGVNWIESHNPTTMQRCPAFPVNAVDTLAAGDVFHGAYAVALAEGAEIAAAMRFASAAAAIKCARPGGRRGAPRRDEVELFLTNAARIAD